MEEYAVETYPNRKYVSTVLANSFSEAIKEALNETNKPRSEYGEYIVHNMRTGVEKQVNSSGKVL